MVRSPIVDLGGADRVGGSAAFGREGAARMERALARLADWTREAYTPPPEDPVLVAGLGWRSGSTLVQRALMTDASILVWGEPMDRFFLLDHLAQPLLAVGEAWPTDVDLISHRPDVDLVRDWVATLSPDPAHLRAAYRAFFDRWLAFPAHQRGYGRWGMKEVRLSGLHALVWRWLYPRGQILLVVRHPVMAYASLRNSGFAPPDAGAVVRWPDTWLRSLEDFATLWNERASSWWEVMDKLGVHWFRYEDLVAGDVDLDAIGASIGLKLASVEAIAATAGGGVLNVAVSADERDRINAITAEGRELFAYAE
jgi:hypothetical protein